MTNLKVLKGGTVLGIGLADYIWLDQNGKIQTKKLAIPIGKDKAGDLVPLADRARFRDGEENRILVPNYFLPDPLRPQPSYIVLCEVKDDGDFPVKWNTRAKLRATMEKAGPDTNLVYFGFEQCYTLTAGKNPDETGSAFLATERQMGACIDAGLQFYGANNTSTLLWNFKIGPRYFDKPKEPLSGLIMSDHLIIARYLMEKIASSNNMTAFWLGLSMFLSTPGIRAPGFLGGHKAGKLRTVLSTAGCTTRIVPPTTRPGVECLEILQKDPGDPYSCVERILSNLYPLEESE